MATLQTFHANQILVRNKNLFFAALDDEIAMLDEQSGNYFTLNSVASKIWKILEEPTSLTDLIRQLIKVYEVDSKQCEQEVVQFLSELAEHNLIEIHPCSDS